MFRSAADVSYRASARKAISNSADAVAALANRHKEELLSMLGSEWGTSAED
jgi:hypothetical protein